MTRSAPLAALLMVLLAIVPQSVAPAADEAQIVFDSPPSDRPALGEVTIAVRVIGSEGGEVVFFVDGRQRGSSQEPPHRLRLSMGDDFGPHRFEAVLRRDGRELARAERLTPGLRVDETLDLRLQQLYVTVTPEIPASRSLEPRDFVVLDDGARQRIVTFERGDAALTTALLVDASDSMLGGRLETALEGARAFMRGMRGFDEATLLLFSDAILYRSPFSQRPEELEASLAAIRAGGGTALNDSLYAAIRGLEERQGRRVVVLLSDGVDVHSVLRMNDLIWTMRRCRSIVYWIELREGSRAIRHLSPWRDAKQHAAEIERLRRLVRESGGRVVRIGGVDQAADAFGEILDELRRQYVIGYYPAVRTGDGSWRPVEIRLRQPRLRARTRGGYLDY